MNDKPDLKREYALAGGCPVCGATTYTEIYDNNRVRGPGFYDWIVGYACDGCSISFKDPSRFPKTKFKHDATTTN